MTNLVVLCGIPGSGKSVLAESYLNSYKNYTVVSTDAIRKELFGDANEQRDGWAVFMEAYERITEALKVGRNVVFDATNVKRQSRKKIIKYFRNLFGYSIKLICVYMCTPLSVCLERNSKRDRKVPEDVIRNMFLHLSTPDMSEGWDEILFNGMTIG